MQTCPTPAAVKERLLAEFERYSQEMTACSKDGRSCKPRCLVMDGAAFALIEDAPLTSLHGPMVSAAKQEPDLENSEEWEEKNLPSAICSQIFEKDGRRK